MMRRRYGAGPQKMFKKFATNLPAAPPSPQPLTECDMALLTPP
jgi:hypothetical protein